MCKREWMIRINVSGINASMYYHTLITDPISKINGDTGTFYK